MTLPHLHVAYEDERFLESDDARPLRILAEYLGPMKRFRELRVHDTIVFYGSARITSDGPLGRYYDDARELARLVTQWSKALPAHAHRYVVCTGGGPGIMEAANRGASNAGGRTIGLNIALPKEQRPNRYITRGLALEFHYFFMRKLWFAHLAAALVAFPGGFGTLDEIMEILTLAQTRKLARHGVIAPDDLNLFRFVDTPQAALEILQREMDAMPPKPTPAFAHSTTRPKRSE